MASTSYITPSQQLINSSTLIKQGAEAVSPSESAFPVTNLSLQKVYFHPNLFPQPTVYSATPSTITESSHPFRSTPVILKHRFSKTYRHPTLNSTLTRTRLAFEARSLTRAQKAGVTVPSVLYVDEKGGVLGLEWVEGWSVREVLGGGAEGELEVFEEEGIEGEDVGEVLDAGGAAAEVEGEGMQALKRVGVSLGESRIAGVLN
jgi:TP53 regulating kinase-like protein